MKKQTDWMVGNPPMISKGWNRPLQAAHNQGIHEGCFFYTCTDFKCIVFFFLLTSLYHKFLFYYFKAALIKWKGSLLVMNQTRQFPSALRSILASFSALSSCFGSLSPHFNRCRRQLFLTKKARPSQQQMVDSQSEHSGLFSSKTATYCISSRTSWRSNTELKGKWVLDFKWMLMLS